MNFHETPHPLPEASMDDLDLTDEMRETLDRIQNIYSATNERRLNEQSVGDKLQELFREGKTDELNDAIEDFAYDLMEQADPEYLELLASRKTNPALSIKERVIEIADNYKRIITSEAGLPDEARFTEIENARTDVAKIIGENPTNPQEALEQLGIIQRDDEGKASYHFPEELVPESVNEKWNTYLATVCAHVEASLEMAKTGEGRAKKENADAVRKYAHDAVTKDVHAILGLEGVNGWDFMQTRALLASIRDEVFPTLGSVKSTPDEETRAHQLVDRYHDKEIRITATLASKHLR